MLKLKINNSGAKRLTQLIRFAVSYCYVMQRRRLLQFKMRLTFKLIYRDHLPCISNRKHATLFFRCIIKHTSSLKRPSSPYGRTNATDTLGILQAFHLALLSPLGSLPHTMCTAIYSYFNLYAPCILYIGQTYRYPPEYTFYIFSQQIYLIIFLDFLSPSSLIPPQNVVYFLMLPFLVHNIFTIYINGVLNCKFTAPWPKV